MNDLAVIPGGRDLVSTAKSFWQRPEGKTGAIFGAGLLALLGVGLYKLLPFLIVLFQNAITATFFGLILAGVVYVILDKKVHEVVWYLYKMAMRKFTGWVIELDPIAILRIGLESLREQMQIMRSQISSLRGQMTSLKQLMDKNREEREASLRTVAKAKEVGKEKAAILNARKAGRLRRSNLTLKDLYDKLEMLYRVLTKMDETASFMLEDMEDEIEVKERERNAILAGHSAFRAALNVIQGNPDKRAMFDQAMEFITQDFAMRVGEIEHFTETARGFIESVDLQNMVFEEEALAELEAWEKRTDDLLLGPGEKQILLEASADPTQVLDMTPGHEREAIPASVRGTRVSPPPYAKLLDLGSKDGANDKP